MKIVIFSEHYTPENDGIGDYTSLLVQELLKSGFEIDVITLAGTGESDKASNADNIHRLRIGKNKTYHQEVISLLELIRPDIVHLQAAISLGKSQKWVYSMVLLPFMLKKHLPYAKIVITFHQYPSQFIEKYLLKRTFGEIFVGIAKHLHSFFCDKICNLVMNKRADSIIIKDLRYRKYINNVPEVKFLRNPSNIPSLWLTENEIMSLRKKYGLEDSRVVIGCFGKLFQEKNIESVLRVLSKIPGSRLLYIGELAGNGYLVKKINSAIKELDLSESVIETGYLPPNKVAECLNIIDVYIALFVRGVSPKNASFTAAVSQGIFSITTSNDRSGYDERENVLYLEPPGDINSVVKGIKTYRGKRIKPDPNAWQRWPDVAEQHSEIYNKLAGAL